MFMCRGANVEQYCRVVCATLFLLLGQGVSADAFPSVENPSIQPGVFLIADSAMSDPYFRQTVVLLWNHGEHGTHGVIINRPRDISLSQALPQVTALRGVDLMLYFGGPVAMENPIFLFRYPEKLQDGQHVFSDVYVSTSFDVLQPLRDSSALEGVLRVYSGHAGWSPGQLASEMAQGAWHLLQGDANFIFNPDPSDVWSKLFEASQAIQVYDQSSYSFSPPAHQF
ncbi:MAG: hypothetical protein CMH81_04745 [Nitrospiraceae bacterium]|nr:hypothetical protein [Nitrospiraceae bacterium]|tara:strand:+ start:3174 stop:3851 length:678 start_codon:yes stop_codon:yes gene_type:complete